LLDLDAVVVDELLAVGNFGRFVGATILAIQDVFLTVAEMIYSKLLKLPVEVEHLLPRSERSILLVLVKVALRGAVALKTPSHLERVPLIGDHHVLHRPVTDVAVDAAIDVNGVVKENELGDLIEKIPLNGSIRFVALANWL
jgi:hypothetical protein